MWSYEAFREEGELLVRRSQRQGDAVWAWRHGARTHLPGNAYLVSMENVRQRRRKRSCVTDDREGGFGGDSDINVLLAMENGLEETEQLDDACVVRTDTATTEDDETVLFEFHIVFHVVYQTPVLYFRTTRIDGSPLAFDAEQIHSLRLPGGNNRAALVAMEDHPVTGTPLYLLHPCETASAMALLLSQPRATPRTANEPLASHQQAPEDNEELHSSPTASPRHLLAWLSLVQPLTHINPLLY